MKAAVTIATLVFWIAIAGIALLAGRAPAPPRATEQPIRIYKKIHGGIKK